MENGNFRPLTESTPLNRSPKICHGWLGRWPLQLRQIWCTSVHWGLLSEWVKYNQNFIYLCIYLYPFSQELTYNIRRVDEFSHMMAQTTRIRARMCRLGFRWYGSSFRGSNPKSPKSPFLGHEYEFSNQTGETKNMHIIETTASLMYGLFTGGVSFSYSPVIS